MNKLICPNCLPPFTAIPANCFEGNIIECTQCRKNALIVFKGRVIEYGRIVVAGLKYLICSEPTGRKKS